MCKVNYAVSVNLNMPHIMFSGNTKRPLNRDIIIIIPVVLRKILLDIQNISGIIYLTVNSVVTEV